MELVDFDPHATALRLLCSDTPVKIIGAPEDWPRWEVLLPHVLAATDQVGETGHLLQPGPGGEQAVQDCSWLLDRAAVFLQVHGRPGEARPLAERALAITEATYDPDHPHVGTHLSILAMILRDLGARLPKVRLDNDGQSSRDGAPGYPAQPMRSRRKSIRDRCAGVLGRTSGSAAAIGNPASTAHELSAGDRCRVECPGRAAAVRGRDLAPVRAHHPLVGVYGAVSVAKYHERAEYHLTQARALTRVLTDMGALADRDTLDEFRKQHYERHPRLHRVRLHSLWTGLHVGIAAYGITLVIITLAR